MLDKFTAAVEKLTLGNGMQDPDIGPLIHDRQIDKQNTHVQDALSKGALQPAALDASDAQPTISEPDDDALEKGESSARSGASGRSGVLGADIGAQRKSHSWLGAGLTRSPRRHDAALCVVFQQQSLADWRGRQQASQPADRCAVRPTNCRHAIASAG